MLNDYQEVDLGVVINNQNIIILKIEVGAEKDITEIEVVIGTIKINPIEIEVEIVIEIEVKKEGGIEVLTVTEIEINMNIVVLEEAEAEIDLKERNVKKSMLYFLLII